MVATNPTPQPNLDIDIKGDTYKTYAEVADAELRLKVEPTRRAAWNALPDDDEKGVMLVAASNRIASECLIVPEDCEESDFYNMVLKPATILLAGTIAGDITAASRVPHRDPNLKRERLDTLEKEYFSPNDGDTETGLEAIDPDVFALLEQYRCGQGKVTITSISSTPSKQSFYDKDRSINRGY